MERAIDGVVGPVKLWVNEPPTRGAYGTGGQQADLAAAQVALNDIVVFAVAGVLAGIGFLFGLIAKFALSRTREFLADAGAVTLTKDPDSLISALRRIADQDSIPGVPALLQAMMISSRIHGLFATHPSIEARIAALEAYAALANRQQSTRTVPPGRTPCDPWLLALSGASSSAAADFRAAAIPSDMRGYSRRSVDVVQTSLVPGAVLAEVKVSKRGERRTVPAYSHLGTLASSGS